MILADTDIQEQLSVIYLSALATSAGFVCAQENLDRTGTDLMVRGGKYGFPQIDWQIKACKTLGEAVDGFFSYPLKKRNYDLLVNKTGHPRLLMVFQMPQEKEKWLSCDNEKLTLRKCAYWISLKGFPESDNSTSVTIKIPYNQTLSVETLQELMDKAKTGSI